MTRRGVRFEFLHRVDRLELNVPGDRVHAIHLTRQDRPLGGGALDPLVRVGGLPCFPSRLAGELLESGQPATLDLERDGAGGHGEAAVLHDGDDFDVVVLGVSLGAVPTVAAELIERCDGWRAMVESVRTVPTQALQLWLGPDEQTLGWPVPGAVVSGYVTPFDTFASMSHLLAVEDWPDADRPRTLAYFCSALREHGARHDPRSRPRHGGGERQPLSRPRHRPVLPRCGAPGGAEGVGSGRGGFDWDLLRGADGLHGVDRLGAQHIVASVDASDRYVQSVPGSGCRRLRADQSGVDNLALAGDWVASGLDAGCLEAAVLAGVQAANVVRGRALRDGVIGTWPGGIE